MIAKQRQSIPLLVVSTVVVSMLFVAAPNAAFGREVEVGWIASTYLHIPTKELTDLGCIRRTPRVEQGIFYNDYYIDVPDDQPKAIISTLDPTVSGDKDPWNDAHYFCSQKGINNLAAEGKIIVSKLEEWEKDIITVINSIFWAIARIGLWVLQWASSLVGPLIAVGSFITNPLVAGGWPFVQGIANLGFLLALLFIAALTVLQIDIGGGIKRLLPRLLIAALLINFSLVIGGFIIDISRLLMAIMVNLLGGADRIGDIGYSILEKSKLFENVYTFSREQKNLDIIAHNSSWAIITDVMKATIAIWLLVGAFIVITVGLLVRYIWLILLLIVSPLAYLAIAFPGLSGQASQWWRSFFKYVIYGPVALFILLLLVNVTSAVATLRLENTFLQQIVQLAITCALIIAAAVAGKQLGIAGAAATVGFVAGQGKRLGRGAGKAAYVGTGARALTRNAQDAGKTIKSNIAGRARDGSLFGKDTALSKTAKFFAGARRDDKGKLKPGEDSLGAKLGRSITPAKSQEAAEVLKDPTGALGAGAPLYAADRLAKGSVRGALTKQQIDVLVRGGTEQQIKLILNDTDVVRTMEKGTQATMLADPRFSNQLLRTLREIDRQDSGK